MKRVFAAVGIVAATGVATLIAFSPRSASPPQAPEHEAAAPWQAQPLSAQAARELLAGGAVLADVREPAELAATGKLDGALNVSLTGLKQHAAHGSIPPELHDAKGRPLILYCRTGRRSGEAGAILLSQGFSQVYNLGGFEDAVKAGLPPA